MKFLDERITFNIAIGSRVQDLPEKGIYIYTLLKTTTAGNEMAVFVGNFYYDKKFNQIIDVTDIIRNSAASYIDLGTTLHTPTGTSLTGSYGWIMDEYWVQLTMEKDGSPLTKTSSHELVANVYRYPNRSKSANLNGTAQFFNYNIDALKNTYGLLLQGWKNGEYSQAVWDRFALVPTYPCKNTGKYAWSVSYGFGNNVSSIYLELQNKTGDYDEDITLSTNVQGARPYSNIWVVSLSTFLENYFYEIELHTATLNDLNLYYFNNSTSTSYLIGKFEVCYSRYYLQWLDRFGCVQSQPFRENITYSESFNNEEIITYEDKRRVSHIQLQPKWKLYSGWIKDELYPYYESIFTSPFIILYDTETNMNYEVIIKDNKYTEKNFKNQKGLVNIELNLEATEKQNITY